MGSGGGARDNGDIYPDIGGNGGGSISIVATEATIDGIIDVRGAAGQWIGGGGAGGSVLLQVTNEIQGNGSINASAGNCGSSSDSGAGGGGRIAVYYGTALSSNLDILALGYGCTTSSGWYMTNGGAGTAYIKKNNGNDSLRLEMQSSGSDITPLIPSIYNIGHLSFDEIIIRGGLIKETALTSTGDIQILGRANLETSVIQAGGDVQLSDYATIHSGGTTATSSEGGSLTVTADTLTIDTNAKIDQTGRGYLGGNADDNTSYDGLTFPAPTGGSTPQIGANGRAGGSHGGMGGVSPGLGTPNPGYGSLYWPTHLGSGGAAFDDGNIYPDIGGNGGGSVLIDVNSLSLNGQILADGTNAVQAGSGGSGGSVLIHMNTGGVTGSGTIQADGGDCASSYYSAGGGGRVAVLEAGSVASGISINARGDDCGSRDAYQHNGAAGTAYVKLAADSEGSLTVSNDTRQTYTSAYHTLLRSVGSGNSSNLSATTLSGSGFATAAENGVGLAGLRINPDITQSADFLITDNTATSITVEGGSNMTNVATSGDTYIGVHHFKNLTVNYARLFTSDCIKVSGSQTIESASGYTDVSSAVTCPP